MTKEKKPEPMTLLHNREKGVDQGIYSSPKGVATLGEIDKAATAMAEWDNSDPFAYNRTALYVRQGFLDPNEVVKEMGQRTIARRVARAREVENAKRGE
jgi:hypothetical protein